MFYQIRPKFVDQRKKEKLCLLLGLGTFDPDHFRKAVSLSIPNDQRGRGSGAPWPAVSSLIGVFFGPTPCKSGDFLRPKLAPTCKKSYDATSAMFFCKLETGSPDLGQ